MAVEPVVTPMVVPAAEYKARTLRRAEVDQVRSWLTTQ